MKNTARSNVYLPLAAMMLTAALTVPAAAQQQVPFMGAMQGHDTDTGLTNNLATVLTVGTGIGTLVGQFSFTQTWTVDVTTGHLTGSAQWFAANGDSISTTITGSGEMIEPGLFRIEEVHAIIGGTGRFAGAQGSFTMTKLASAVTFLTSGSYEGTMTPPGVAHRR
jgi:hypothetical protein